MRLPSLWSVVALTSLLAMGCGDEEAGACALDTDCPAGMVCEEGRCGARGGIDAGADTDGGSGTDAGSEVDAGEDGAVRDAAVDAAADAASDAGPPACDHLPGTYLVAAVSGDCSSIAVDDAITVTRADNPSLCVMGIESSDTTRPVLDGSAPVEPDGTFTETALGVAGEAGYECSGMFSHTALQVSCTRTGTAEACMISLTRS